MFLRARRYARKEIATGFCPNCFGLLPDDARQCSQCDWHSMDSQRDRATDKRRRLALKIRATLTYERVVFCTHCACNVRTTTDFCSVCQNSFQAQIPLVSDLTRVRTHLRAERTRKAVAYATLCPHCEILLPDWSEQCFCCGWERPARANMSAAFRHLVQSATLSVSPAPRRVKTEDVCPTCDVCVPPFEKMCMICGWEPLRKPSLRDGLRTLHAEKAQRAMQARQKKLRVCAHCDLPLLPGDSLCMVCGWQPAPSAVQRLSAMRLRPRKVVAAGRPQHCCPTCQTALAQNSKHCRNCGWDPDPASSWARRPKMIWLAPVCLTLYTFLILMFLQMADPENKTGQVDRFGRTGQEGRKVLVSARPH